MAMFIWLKRPTLFTTRMQEFRSPEPGIVFTGAKPSLSPAAKGCDNSFWRSQSSACLKGRALGVNLHWSHPIRKSWSEIWAVREHPTMSILN